VSKISVFGNGESRQSINLNDLDPEYIKIGCNAIHRDYSIDHLVCCDRRMIEEAVENPLIKDTFIHVREEQYHYFRKVRKNKKIQLLPDIPYQGQKRADNPTHWGSGPYAVLVACLLNPSEINLYGFDLYSKTDYINNIYKGTKNYKHSIGSAVDPSYWIYQISKLFVEFPNINFRIYNEKEWSLPLQWQHSNVKKLELSCSINKYLV
jgi:hypothetical protein